MWPLLFTSIVSLTVVVDRFIFVLRQEMKADPEAIEAILLHARTDAFSRAIERSGETKDPIAKVLAYGLTHRDASFSNALVQAASEELKRYQRGISVLDTVVTLAPLLGLLGTVTGMIRSFGLLGVQELGTPMAITGGIAEALIATAYGLTIAIVTLIPLNFLNNYSNSMKYRLEKAGTDLELALSSLKASSAYEATGKLR